MSMPLRQMIRSLSTRHQRRVKMRIKNPLCSMVKSYRTPCKPSISKVDSIFRCTPTW